MDRRVEAIEGLALLGEAEVGGVRLETPGLLWSRPNRTSPALEGISLEAGDDQELGHRAVRWVSPGAELLIAFPAPSAEITGTGSVAEAGPGAWMVHWPPPAADLNRLESARPSLIVLANGRDLWTEGESFVLAIGTLRRQLGARPLLWIPRLALPNRLALLSYLSVDVVDTTAGLWAASEGIRLDPTLGPVGGKHQDRITHSSSFQSPAETPTDPVELAYRQELELVRRALGERRLRELVEARLSSEPVLAEMLRYTDRKLSDLLEERTPVVGTGQRNYVLSESHRRPEVVRFRHRLLERYRPPPSKEVLLLVPCSKSKPYRLSHSHRRFDQALENLEGRERVHVVSVSSPMGLVPRELEEVYPVAHYDIPVTGEWSEPERDAIVKSLEHLLSMGKYRSVVVHLDPSEYGFVAGPLDSVPNCRWTISNHSATSSESIRTLRDAVESALATHKQVPGGPLGVVKEELQELAAFQFGPESAGRLFAPPIRLHGRPWFQRITDDRSHDLATYRSERGLFHLTVAGAARIFGSSPLEVEVRPELELTGDLFVPGVRNADSRIRTGDDVLLVREERLLGVGDAALPGKLMTELDHGLAVQVRHRVKVNGAGPKDP